MLSKLKKYKIYVITSVSVLCLYAFVDNYFEVARNLDLFSTVYREVNANYVDPTDPGKMLKKGVDSMLSTLDPYTNYIPESDIEDFRFMTTGQYGGIGAQIRQKGQYVAIADPYEGFAADKAGLRAGDMILEVDGKSIKGKKTDDMSKLLKGQPQTSVKLLIERVGEPKPFEKLVVREEIKVKSVPYFAMLDNEVGYIRLISFTDNCGKDVKDALLELKKSNLKYLILDLRGNPGGLLNEAVNISNIFVAKGQEVVTTKGRYKDQEKKYLTVNDPVDVDIPLAVLVNRGSASASEIVSGSIQDLDRGIIVGQRTFGKGLVQITRDLTFNAKVKVTVAKYYIPSGRCIQALDYSHRNEDGSVGKVPDSLITPFKTHTGRVVYDGGGVLPDVAVESFKSSNIANSLASKGLVFDYATLYRSKHNTIAGPKEFALNDNDFNDFLNFINNKEYDYTSKSEKALEELKANADKEKYSDVIKEEYETLKNKLVHNKKEELLKNKAEVLQILKEQIVMHYYHQKGLIQAQLNSDEEILKAKETLKDSNKYQAILKGTYANPNPKK